MGDRLVFLFGSLWQIFKCGLSCVKSFIRTDNTHFNDFLNQFEGLYDHFGKLQVVAKICPAIVCFQAQILRVATRFASFSIRQIFHFFNEVQPKTLMLR